MCAQAVNPWQVAMEEWMGRVQNARPSLVFLDAWMRLNEMNAADLQLTPHHLGERQPWTLLGLKMTSFGREVGQFACAARDGQEQKAVVFSCPHFSSTSHPDLIQATLRCLYHLAPVGSELKVVLEDQLGATVSTLAVAGTYTDAGWELNPKRTELVSEQPRLWIFRFTKN